MATIFSTSSYAVGLSYYFMFLWCYVLGVRKKHVQIRLVAIVFLLQTQLAKVPFILFFLYYNYTRCHLCPRTQREKVLQFGCAESIAISPVTNQIRLYTMSHYMYKQNVILLLLIILVCTSKVNKMWNSEST